MSWDRLQALLWLRWRLSRNQWQRDSQVGAVLTMIVLVLCLGLAAAGGIAGLLGGTWGVAKLDPFKIMLVWDGLVAAFLVFWTVGIVVELQRSDIIDLGRLLHLPVSLWEAFLLNYLASHVSLSLAMMLPAMLGLAAGLTLGRGFAMLLLFPLVFAFFFAITAWTYCLRGWLASLMVNKRRRRAIIMGITMAFVLLSQLPNLVMNVFPIKRGAAPQPPQPPRAGEHILDNGAAAFSGAWSTGTSATDKYDSDYRHATSGSGGTATYNAAVSRAGNYQVSIWYSQGANRADNVPLHGQLQRRIAYLCRQSAGGRRTMECFGRVPLCREWGPGGNWD